MTNHVDHAAPRHKTWTSADRTCPHVPSNASETVVDFAAQLSVGGKLVHRRTRRCVSFCRDDTINVQTGTMSCPFDTVESAAKGHDAEAAKGATP